MIVHKIFSQLPTCYINIINIGSHRPDYNVNKNQVYFCYCKIMIRDLVLLIISSVCMMLLSNINYPEYYLCWLTWEAIDQTSHKLVYNTFQTYHSSIQYFNLCDYIGHNWFDKLITYIILTHTVILNWSLWKAMDQSHQTFLINFCYTKS